MTILHFEVVGAKNWKGEITVEDGMDPDGMIKQMERGLLDCIEEQGCQVEKKQYLYSKLAVAIARDFLTEAAVNIGQIPVIISQKEKSGWMRILMLIALDPQYQSVRIPFSQKSVASEVIAELRKYFHLGPNERVVLLTSVEGNETPIASDLEVKAFPTTPIYWKAMPYD